MREYLTRYGVLNREELIRITQISSQSKLDSLDILSSEGFLSETELTRHSRNQIQEALHEVLTWDKCTYKFVSSRDVADGIKSVGEFSIEGMLLESMRRIDEFPGLQNMFPNEGILITRTNETPDPDNDEITKNAKSVLELLDKTVSLRDLIACAKMPRFEVYESLKLLEKNGLVTTRHEENQVARQTPSPWRTGPLRSPR